MSGYNESMATLHGELPRAAAERCLARAGERLPDGWHLFFNVHWIYRDDILRAELPGEADAVFYHPDHGIAVVEVKGGGIEREGERWFSVDAHRRWHSIQSPLAQASHGVYAFRRGLRNIAHRLGGTDAPPPVPRIEPMVCFPDIPPVGEGDAFGEDLPRRCILDFQDLEHLEERLLAVLTWPSPWTHCPPKAEYHREICQYFHPQMRALPLLREAVRNEEALYTQALLRQERILQAVDENDRLLILGAAGTGKLALAIDRAADLAAHGKRTVLLCETPLWAQHLASFPELHAVEVTDRRSFLTGIVRQAGLDPEGDLGQNLSKALAITPSLRRDAMVCLEAERIPASQWELLESALTEKHGLTLLADPHAVSDPLSLRWPDGMAKCRLDCVVHSTRSIFAWIAMRTGLYLELDPICPHGTEVRELRWTAAEEQEELLRQELNRLLSQEGVEPDQIAVLSAKSSRDESPLGAWKDPRLKWVTKIGGWNAGKGVMLPEPLAVACNAPVVILVDVDESTDPVLIYRLASRARHFLVVLARS